MTDLLCWRLFMMGWLAGGLFWCGSAGLLAAEVHILKDLVYREVEGEKLQADLYLPAESSGPPRPAVVMIHGGGWAHGNRQVPTMVSYGNALAEAGIVAMSIQYRLVKEGPNGSILNQWPAAIDDSRAAVRWLRTNAQKYRIDPDHLGAIGESAGGHLVSLLGTTDDGPAGEPSSRVQAVVNIFGPADLTQNFAALTPAPGPGPQVQMLVDRFLGSKLPSVRKEASPRFHIDDQTAAFLILHGTEDPVVPISQSREFYEQLSKKNRDAKLREFSGDKHGFRPENQKRVVQLTVNFFLNQLIYMPRRVTKEQTATP